MKAKPYIPGLKPADPGPLSRFLPPLEEGVVSGWLSHQSLTGNWLLDPFGFSPRLALEAARSGFRVLVTANNPISRFLLETFANPPAEADFNAALADLAAVKKGEERLGVHLQSLYSTPCEQCGQIIQASAFLWRKAEELPYARIYECQHCGDSGEHEVTAEDIERVKLIAATDALHRRRAFERVVSLKDEDRIYAEEAVQHYLPRPLYVLTTIINRMGSMNLNPERKRALTALLLLACDAGNMLWAHPAERPRPKILNTPNQFREHNIWIMLERGLSLWTETGAKVICEAWPKKIPEEGGILIYEGRLKDLAREVKKEIPIAAVIGSIPRPNQAFWTLSALWAGWLWGSEAVEPYKVALRRRRYDWAWNATALHAMFSHLNDLLADGVPVFGMLPEPEPPFITAVLSAAHTAGFNLENAAIRTEHDPVQLEWVSAQKQPAAEADSSLIKDAVYGHLVERGEPAGYLHLHIAALCKLSEANMLKPPQMEFDEALKKTHARLEEILKKDQAFIHYTSGESVETGMWGLRQNTLQDSLADRVEMAMVTFLQKTNETFYLEIENEINRQFPGLLTPSKGLIYAVLNSYTEKEGGAWKLRAEDSAVERRGEMNRIFNALGSIGKRLRFTTHKEDKFVHWEQNGQTIRSFYVLASALIGRAMEQAAANTILVIPGGRASLITYKTHRDPALAEKLRQYKMVKYRLIRVLQEAQMLTRETFEQQIQSDPVEKDNGQMVLF